MLDGIEEIMSCSARAKGIALSHTLEPGIPNLLRGDPGRLRQILLNLIGNAIKFTPHGSVKLDIRRVFEDTSAVTLQFKITDTGIGIPKDKLKHIFTKFYQVDTSTTRQFAGTGLGLAICEQLVGLLGGEIGVESTAGKGSVFHFTAVFKKQSGAMEETVGVAPSAIREPLRQLRVLVAEDHTTNQAIAVRILEKLGHVAVGVGDGEEAIAELRLALLSKAIAAPEPAGKIHCSSPSLLTTILPNPASFHSKLREEPLYEKPSHASIAKSRSRTEPRSFCFFDQLCRCHRWIFIRVRQRSDQRHG